MHFAPSIPPQKFLMLRFIYKTLYKTFCLFSFYMLLNLINIIALWIVQMFLKTLNNIIVNNTLKHYKISRCAPCLICV